MKQYFFLDTDNDDYYFIVIAESYREATNKIGRYLVDRGVCEDVDYYWECVKSLDLEAIIK